MTVTGGDGVRRLGGVTPARPARPAGRGSGFRLPDASASAGVGALAAPENVALAGLLAAQEAEPQSARDRAASQHGRRTLDLLRDLQCASLGGDPRQIDDALTRLADFVDNPPLADDARLQGVLREIAVRAAVELARRGR